MEIPGKKRASEDLRGPEIVPQTRSHLKPPETYPNPRNTFNATRPPMPIPPMPVDNVKSANKYESIDSPLTEKDLVQPAYCTVDEETGNLVLPPSEEPSSSHTNFSVGQYGNPKNKAPLLTIAPLSVYASSEYLDDNDQSEVTQVDAAIPHYATVDSSKSYAKRENDGYLSTEAAEKTIAQTSQGHYVVPNELSSNNLEKHFQKPVPRPAINVATTSLPTLLDNNRGGSVNGPPPKPIRRKQLSSTGVKRIRDRSPSNSVERYQSPRPSAPDIFVQGAYQSTEDIDRVRIRLQMISAQHSNLSDTDSEGKLSQLRAESNFYDSPRSSPATSLTSLTGQQPKDFYATPRPSLPQVNPDEIKRLVAENTAVLHS